MSIKIRRLKWPSEMTMNIRCNNKDAREGVAIKALPGGKNYGEKTADKGTEIGE